MTEERNDAAAVQSVPVVSGAEDREAIRDGGSEMMVVNLPGVNTATVRFPCTHSTSIPGPEMTESMPSGRRRLSLADFDELREANGRLVIAACAADHSRDVAMALARALTETNARLEQAPRLLIDALEADRSRIAHELHDEIGQSMITLILQLLALSQRLGPDLDERAAACVQTAREAMQRVRDVALGLRPAQLDDFGLGVALRGMVDRVKHHTPCTLRLTDRLDERRFDRESETCIFRVTQEALTNALRHAGAGRIDILLEGDAETLSVQVADDGTGFPSPAPAERPPSVGLVSMTERVKALGGTLQIRSSARGTTIEAHVPARHRSSEHDPLPPSGSP